VKAHIRIHLVDKTGNENVDFHTAAIAGQRKELGPGCNRIFA
jgi:hypothetical protein